jgi:hypothetical protein
MRTRIYASGINPVFIIGAEPLPGIGTSRVCRSPRARKRRWVEEEEEEVDYDESKEALNDD